jgi:hypothetical protein
MQHIYPEFLRIMIKIKSYVAVFKKGGIWAVSSISRRLYVDRMHGPKFIW